MNACDIRNDNRLAFSLVELSIVLVILGLLVGGVLSGQALIRAAELRSVTTQLSEFSTARNSFKDKYFALPGDMPNATQFWPAADPADAFACYNALVAGVSGNQTCNGTGDGYLYNGTPYSEVLLYWQHLSNAGLINGKFSGNYTAAPFVWNSSNSPSGRINNAIWTVSDVSGALFYYLFSGKTSGYPSENVLRPEEMWKIDTKLDDGKPQTGNVLAYASYSHPNNCTTTITPTADYILTSSDISCYGTFIVP